MSHPDWVSISEFARRADCDRQEVYRAIKKGLISKRDDGLVDGALASGQWRRPNQRTVVKRATKAGVTSRVVTGDVTTSIDGETPAEAAERLVAEHPLLTLDEAMRLKENYLARHQQLSYDLKAGTVVLIDDVAKAVGAEYAGVRKKLLAIPAERAPAIHRLKTVAEVEDYLRSVIVEALEELTSDGAPPSRD